MADEFFRPYLRIRRLGAGRAVGGLWYNAMLGNSNSALDIKATQLDRSVHAERIGMVDADDQGVRPEGRAMATGNITRSVATRFGFSTTHQPRAALHRTPTTARRGNTTLRLADSVNVFDTGALAAGITVEHVGLHASCRSTRA